MREECFLTCNAQASLTPPNWPRFPVSQLWNRFLSIPPGHKFAIGRWAGIGKNLNHFFVKDINFLFLPHPPTPFNRFSAAPVCWPQILSAVKLLEQKPWGQCLPWHWLELTWSTHFKRFQEPRMLEWRFRISILSSNRLCKWTHIS